MQTPILQKPESETGPKSGAGPACRAARGPRSRAQNRILKGGIETTTEYLFNKEVERVLDALMPENRLIIRVILHTGLRISDVLNLKPEQLSPQFWITEQKTGKRRRVNLPGPLLADLKRNAGKYWVFQGYRDPKKHKTRQAVWHDVKRAAAAFRLPQNVGTHSARKVYAVDLLQKYGDIERVRRALNHSKKYPSTTLIYATADALLEAKYKRRGRKKA